MEDFVQTFCSSRNEPITSSPQSRMDTDEIRELLTAAKESMKCVWVSRRRPPNSKGGCYYFTKLMCVRVKDINEKEAFFDATILGMPNQRVELRHIILAGFEGEKHEHEPSVYHRKEKRDRIGNGTNSLKKSRKINTEFNASFKDVYNVG